MVNKTLMRQISQILESRQTSPFFRSFYGGPYVQAFEKDFARYVHVKYAVSVANGTLALNAAYSALGPWMSSEPFTPKVLTAPYTFVATASELVRTGLTPVFVDVEVGNGAISAAAIAREAFKDIVAVVPMHPLGSPCDMEAIRTKVDIPKIIEDACQALSPTYKLWGLAACFSFQATKSLTTGGEGGMVVTNCADFYEKLCYIRNTGQKYGPLKEKLAYKMGTNLRMTEIQAVIGLHALKGYDKVVKHQLMLGKILLESMDDHHQSGWLIPQQPWSTNGYIFAGRISRSLCCGSECTGPHTLALKHRSKFLKKVKHWNKGVPGKVICPGYSELVYELPAFRSYARPCPVAEMWRDHAVWFDLRGYSQEEVKTISRAVEKFRP